MTDDWTIQNGKLSSCQCHVDINVTNHCNLSCKYCNHLADRLHSKYVDLQQVRKDLEVVSKFMALDSVKLVGGEPLLHPNLEDIIDIAKEATGVYVVIYTNGVLLSRMSDGVWRKIDEIIVSKYPKYYKDHIIEELRETKAKAFKTHLQVGNRLKFNYTYTSIMTEDDELVQRIYNTCLFTQHWNCSLVDEGYFYKCSVAVHLQDVIGRVWDRDLDRVKIRDSEEFREELFEYLTSKEPIEACKYCLGSVGKQFDHDTHAENYNLAIPAKEILDYSLLEKIEGGWVPEEGV